ncbi:MAG: Zn-ribbon containing protein [Candidatus Pacearchaeota archaeon]
MAHRCVRCGKIYPSTAQEILKGCPCGSHYFFFFREDDLSLKEETARLTPKEREEIVKDVKTLIGPDVEKPIILNLESIRVRKPGKFELDLVNILKRKPIIYKLEEGKYIIDIASTFQMRKKLSEVEAEIEAELGEPEPESPEPPIEPPEPPEAKEEKSEN